jgi:hypothetical protein
MAKLFCSKASHNPYLEEMVTEITEKVFEIDGYQVAERLLEGIPFLVYFDDNAERQIVNTNVGSINYDTGLVTLTNLNIISLTTFDNLIRLTIESEKGIVKSFRNTIITLDDTDPTSITTELVEI